MQKQVEEIKPSEPEKPKEQKPLFGGMNPFAKPATSNLFGVPSPSNTSSIFSKPAQPNQPGLFGTS